MVGPHLRTVKVAAALAFVPGAARQPGRLETLCMPMTHCVDDFVRRFTSVVAKDGTSSE